MEVWPDSMPESSLSLGFPVPPFSLPAVTRLATVSLYTDPVQSEYNQAVYLQEVGHQGLSVDGGALQAGRAAHHVHRLVRQLGGVLPGVLPLPRPAHTRGPQVRGRCGRLKLFIRGFDKNK